MFSKLNYLQKPCRPCNIQNNMERERDVPKENIREIIYIEGKKKDQDQGDLRH